ncbi:MAG: hypothetical protein PHF18_11680 [Methanosarcina sp.]|uniref:hypothetical protein n=1 Tax=Methanosarcina sp. TaxID=2213 RepID=UPI00261C6020|nr:hypothetical protein [Methanosarcina sp.]MDD3247491.1 hypothetical protein [Methanosarcina sp.]MDD4247744.1 hypothetical protein [Methanosarcina sp.]
MDRSKISTLSRFGFRFEKGGVHTSRTMMLEDLKLLLSYVSSPSASKIDYIKAIEEDNCLSKRSGKTRKLTGQHLVELYSLDSSITIFRALRYFWERDTDGQPLLALICAYSRDALLRMSAPFIMQHKEGETVNRETLEVYIEKKFPDRFSKATLKSLAQNLNSTWTKSGHLIGKAKKVRSRASATPGSVSYALFLGYLTGVRGEELFRTEYACLLDCSINRSIELAEEASRRGWIVFKRIGDVMEVLFPNLLTEQEREWIREQN